VRDVIQIECRDNTSVTLWIWDFCEAHAKPRLAKAQRLKPPMSWL
jgi:hypothetical protein